MNNTAGSSVFSFDTNRFTSQLNNVKKTGSNKWIASCPCSANHKHGDKQQSLSVAFDQTTGNVLVYCHCGCSVDEIVSSVGCSLSDLSPMNNRNGLMKSVSWYAKKCGFRLDAVYNYSFPYNDGLYKIRFTQPDGSKTFRWIREDNQNRFGYSWSRTGIKNRLYVAGSLSDPDIFIAEGEKDADTVHRITGKTCVSAENGATKGNINKKWTPEYTEQLTGKNVYILFDNDTAGRAFAQIELSNIQNKAQTVRVLDICNVWEQCPEKGDISDMVTALGDDETVVRLHKLIESTDAGIMPEVTEATADAPDQPQKTADQDEKRDITLPPWVIESEYHGHITRKINEPLFCEIFQRNNTVVRINGVFYLKGRQVSDELILSMIQNEIKPYFSERTGRKTNDLFITLQNASFIQQPEPDEHRIYCDDGKTLIVSDDGSVSVINEDVFTLTRLSVKYNPVAECPLFINYINELLYPDDIPAVQEYMGYCLIPSTRAQAGLFIRGKGGEGKSCLTDIMMKMFGYSAIQEGIHHLSERFVLANLENKLVCVDDDMKASLLSDTDVIKKIITNSPTKPLQVERKNRQKYNTFLFSRIFAMGNSFIGSKFDHSDGFYRRQLLIDCKLKKRESDDRFMSEKLFKEIDGIFLWSLAGLIRLIKNGYNFTISDRMKRTLDDVKHEGDNSLTFFEDDSVILQGGEWEGCVSSADLFAAYALWCYDNGETPMKRRTFHNKTSERFKIYKIRIQTPDGRQQGFSHLSFSESMEKRLKYMDEKTLDRIRRLP